MAEFGAEKRVVISSDSTTLTDSVARRLLHRIARRTQSGKVAHIVLTGGVMGLAVLRSAAADPGRTDVDWSLVHFWWGDENYVPSDSPHRNERQAREALLDEIDVPEQNIHAMAASDSGLELDAVADAYAQELARFATAEQDWPRFDVCFLGVGPDGHIASLFPDRPEITVTDAVAIAVRDSPVPPAERVSLTRPVINSSKRVWLVLSGHDKASALGLALAGAAYPTVPAAGAKGTRSTVFFVDAAAAEQVPAELIDQDY
ncbi:6-phosphogluconolactonase [Microbacterium terricola]|uniref:6-phosphogluconolactonase n=1 Tax=Microbacterium terricola TaxID=344163 RepID=A0ABM8DXW7_9MICO|nr:6-phosphogluconolactonase [Microbacterium terricola]UYK38840.1 6-phosphogluconolactonase [Microbacterium terricola]BDV30464.1 6-phosphogluconolactonase [Microbacterium terricola]